MRSIRLLVCVLTNASTPPAILAAAAPTLAPLADTGTGGTRGFCSRSHAAMPACKFRSGEVTQTLRALGQAPAVV